MPNGTFNAPITFSWAINPLSNSWNNPSPLTVTTPWYAERFSVRPISKAWPLCCVSTNLLVSKKELINVIWMFAISNIFATTLSNMSVPCFFPPHGLIMTRRCRRVDGHGKAKERKSTQINHRMLKDYVKIQENDRPMVELVSLRVRKI